MFAVHSSLMAVAAFAGGCVGGWLAAQGAVQPRPTDIVRAKAFIVVDDKGIERVLVGDSAEGTGLAIKDLDGKVRLALAMTADGSGTGLSMTDRNQKQVIGLGSSKGDAALVLSNEDGKPGIGLGIDKDNAGLVLNDSQGVEHFSLGVSRDGKNAGFGINYPNGKVCASFGTGGTGTGITFFDPSNAERLNVSMIPNGASAFVLKGSDGKEIWRAP